MLTPERPIAMSLVDDGCCALKDGHDGPCAWVCSDRNGTTKCWACEGDAGLDDVTDCSECDGTGDCFRCYEGMEVDE